MKKLFALIATIFILFMIMINCKKNEEGNNVPQVVSCDEVKYKEYTYYISGCSGSGVASFDVTTTQNGHSASFHIVCSGGCIHSATVK